MIDLHLHTIASDGLLPADTLVSRAAASGLGIISITDHDTTAAIGEAATAAARHGIRLVPGIEVTAVEGNRDVHVLGYFIDPDAEPLVTFLCAQRADRLERVREMSARLRALGVPVDETPILNRVAGTGRSVGRPALADALVAAGHAADREEAFARWLAHDRAAFVPRRGASAARVVQIIHAVGGIASLAHPGLLGDDALVARLRQEGLDAVEVWHSDHTPAERDHYAALADHLGLAKSGGSDFHGDGVHRAGQLGAVVLPASEFARLEEVSRVRRREPRSSGSAGVGARAPID